MHVPHRHIVKREKPPKPRNLVARSIRQGRQSLQLTHEDLCGRVAKYGASLSRTQVAKIEAGTRPVFDYELVALAKALRTSVLVLLPKH